MRSVRYIVGSHATPSGRFDAPHMNSTRPPLQVFKSTARMLSLNFLALAVLILQPLPALALDSAAMQSMVLIEGDDGAGSGFLVRMDGKIYLITNSHVLCGNRNVKFKSMANRELTTKPFEIADAADLVR